MDFFPPHDDSLLNSDIHETADCILCCMFMLLLCKYKRWFSYPDFFFFFFFFFDEFVLNKPFPFFKVGNMEWFWVFVFNRPQFLKFPILQITFLFSHNDDRKDLCLTLNLCDYIRGR